MTVLNCNKQCVYAICFLTFYVSRALSYSLKLQRLRNMKNSLTSMYTKFGFLIFKLKQTLLSFLVHHISQVSLIFHLTIYNSKKHFNDFVFHTISLYILLLLSMHPIKCVTQIQVKISDSEWPIKLLFYLHSYRH